MRNLALLGAVAFTVAASVAFAAVGGRAAPRPTLAQAIERTSSARSQHYEIHVRMTRAGEPLSLHILGQAGPHVISVKLRLGDMHMPDGTTLPGTRSAALLDGPFLYERAPSGLAVFGAVHWLRLTVADLAPASPDLAAVNAMTPAPILRVLEAARMARAPIGAHLFHGTVPYDHLSIRRGLAKLTGGLEFRGLRVSVLVGEDGLVHRVVLTGHTADGATAFSLRARLYGFDLPLRVAPPAPGTFMNSHSELVA